MALHYSENAAPAQFNCTGRSYRTFNATVGTPGITAVPPHA